MADLTELSETYKESVAAATHLLIVGPSKSGKSDYLAQAAIDGFDVIYVENDNGLPTLMERLAGKPEAMKRVNYFNPKDFKEFVRVFLKGTRLIYNERTRNLYASQEAQPDDKLTILYPLRMMRRKNIVASFDSWTTLCYDAMEDAATKQKTDLTSIDKFGREIYGPSGFFMTQIAQLIQLSPLNIVVQAHPSIYEIKEKPPGGTQKETKEGDMIIRDTWEIPQSTSNPHGYSIGKHFNQIGWLDVDRFNRYRLSFKPKYRRIVGGTPTGEGDPRTEFSFKTLFGGGLVLPVAPAEENHWIEKTTVAEYQAATKGVAAVKAAAPTPAAKPPVTTAAAAPAATQTAKPPLKLGGGSVLKLGK